MVELQERRLRTQFSQLCILYVSYCPVSTLPWTDYPISSYKTWLEMVHSCNFLSKKILIQEHHDSNSYCYVFLL